MFELTDKKLIKIEEKVDKNLRLTFDDGMALFESSDFLGVGYLANKVRKRKNGTNTYFINNRHINYTNICKNSCRFCAFAKEKNENSAYQMDIESVLKAASSNKDVSEFHIVGGLHPDLPFKYYLEMIGSIHNKFPDVHIQAFTAVEIDHFSKIFNLPVTDTLKKLKNAGLGSLPGGGAEIFDKVVRNKLCEEKISGLRWLEVMEKAHNIGLKSNATMLYGHIETPEHRISHLIRLRELQDKTGGFMAFIPLAFHPKNTDLNTFSKTTANLDLKVHAISRLMLDNFPHIKAFWIMIGLKLAQVSLHFGVDDIDGTVVEEKITHSAGAETAEFVKREELVRIIKDAGMKPLQRDTLYNIVKAY